MSNKKDRKSVWTTLKQPQKQRGNFYNTATTTKQKGRQKYKRMEIISPMFGKQQSQNWEHKPNLNDDRRKNSQISNFVEHDDNKSCNTEYECESNNSCTQEYIRTTDFQNSENTSEFNNDSVAAEHNYTDDATETVVDRDSKKHDNTEDELSHYEKEEEEPNKINSRHKRPLFD